MIEIKIYKSIEQIPKEIEIQIRTFLRVVWYGEEEEKPDEPITREELNPVYFVLSRKNILISYARVIWMNVEYMGSSYKMYGLGDVFTFPSSRRKGYGSQIVELATQFIRKDSQADIAILFTEPKLEYFYKLSGWNHVSEIKFLVGEQPNPELYKGFHMMFLLSQKAQDACSFFPSYPVFLPGDEW